MGGGFIPEMRLFLFLGIERIIPRSESWE